jgi:hypothetical protein
MVAGIATFALVAIAFTPLAFAQDKNAAGQNRVGVESETTTKTMVDTEERAKILEAKRTEAKARLDAVKEKRQTSLDEKRLAACDKKADKVNSIIQKRSAQGTKHLAVFKKIADRVQSFVTDKELTIENYDQLVATITEKEQAVTAAIEANTNTVFDCESADGSNPGSIARASVQGVRDALKEYRTAIKDLIVKVKSNNATKEDSSSEATTETESSTGEGQ